MVLVLKLYPIRTTLERSKGFFFENPGVFVYLDLKSVEENDHEKNHFIHFDYNDGGIPGRMRRADGEFRKQQCKCRKRKHQCQYGQTDRCGTDQGCFV